MGLLSLALLVGCSPTSRESTFPPKKTTIAATTLPGSAPVYVADELGFFRDAGLDADIETFGAGRLALEAVLDGKADFATVAETPVARAVLDGKTPAVVATIAEIDGANYIVARKDKGIAVAKDLEGKRIGVLEGTTADFFLHIYLVTSGVDPVNVEIVGVKIDEIVPMVVDGRLDGASAFAPYTSQLEKRLGSNAAVLDQPGLYTLTWNVAVRREYARTDQETVERLLRAIERANEYILENPASAQAITARRTGSSVPDLKKQWAAHVWTMSLDQSLVLSLEDEARWMSDARGPNPDFLDYLDTAALRTVSPQGVDLVEPGD